MAGKGNIEIPATVPGPCPWYFGPHWPDLKGYSWERGEGPNSSGCAILRRKKERLAIVAMYSYVMPLEHGLVLTWRQGRTDGGNGPMRMTVFDPARLERLDDALEGLAKELTDAGEPVHCKSGIVGQCGIPTGRCGRDVRVDLPKEIEGIGELLMLCRSDGAARKGSGGRGNLAIAVLQPAKGTVRLHAQHWFNEGEYDFDYEWPTRVCRDPKTGLVCGDGIRMGAFRLNAELTGLA